MIVLAFLIQAEDPAGLLAIERARTSAATRCVLDGDSTDITVCGLRHADRFRVPLVTRTVGRSDDVPSERAELLHRNTPIQDLGPFLVGGGMVGVHAGTSFGHGAGSGHVTAGGVRPIAP